MDTATALDHARSFYARIVKPFERLPEILEAAVTAETLVREAEGRLAALAEQEHDARNRLQVLALDLPLKEAEVEQARAHAAEVLAEQDRLMREATQAAQEVIRAAEASAAAKLAQLEADHAARLSQIEATEAARLAELDADYKARHDQLAAALGGR